MGQDYLIDLKQTAGTSFKTITFQFDDTNTAEMTFQLSCLHRSVLNLSVIIYTQSTQPFKIIWALFIISPYGTFSHTIETVKKKILRGPTQDWMCCTGKNDCLLFQRVFFYFASKVANINCQELQKHLTGKRLARRRRRELLCSSSLPEETPHRTEIGTRSGASCNWPAAAVEGSTSCFCPALPHCCSL